MAVSPDKKWAVTGGQAGIMAVWDAATGKPFWRQRPPTTADEEQNLQPQQPSPPDAKWPPAPQPGQPAPPRSPGVYQVVFSTDGSRLYSQLWYGPVHESKVLFITTPLEALVGSILHRCEMTCK